MKYHGIALQIGSIRTKQSLGIGSYLELIPLIHLCKKINFNLIQLLPIYDSHLDSSPYNALTCQAYNPIYITLDKKELLQNEFIQLTELNKSNRLDYEKIIHLKMKILKRLYEQKYILIKNELEIFLKKNPELEAYSTFKYLKEKYNHIPFIKWDDTSLSKESIKQKFKEFEKECFFYIYIQYLIDNQLSEVKKEADLLNISLMCDIPILMSSDSLEVFLDPQYFDLSHVVGTPPDNFNKEGQYWGLPPYNWVEIENSGYKIWKNKFQLLEKFFSIFRIDHILGFFRFYIIPTNSKPSLGHYVPKKESLALIKGKERLQILCSLTKMSPIGEDLGTKPDGLDEILQELKIAQTKIIRWEKKENNFIPLNKYPYKAAVSLSTHDTTNFLQWWGDNQEDQHKFCNLFNIKWQKECDSSFIYEILKKFHQIDCLYKINLIGEYLSLNPKYISKNPEDDRINTPGTVSKKNWSYRMKPTIEELNLDHQWIKKMQILGELN